MSAIKSLFIVLLFFATFIFGANGSNVLTKGKYILTYEESFDDVYTEGVAKSTKTKCQVKIDIKRSLLSVVGCSVKKIQFFTKEDMWLGNLVRPGFTGSHFGADSSFRNVYAPFDYEDAAYMFAEFEAPTQLATDLNLYKVSCPKGMTKKIYGLNAVCLTPYKCGKGEYSLDEFVCEELPENARRKPKVGFECLPGYFWKDDYYCAKKVSCKFPNLYDKEKNECYVLPKNAKWNEDASSEDDYECISGYGLDNDTHECRKELTSCGKDKVLSDDRFSCESIPENAHKESEEIWNCNEMYSWNPDSRQCQKKREDCEDGFVLTYNQFDCVQIPTNSHKISPMSWACDRGYVQDDDRCLKIPDHSRIDEYGEIVCDDDYVFIKEYPDPIGVCKKRAECNENEYRASDFICLDVPKNAVKTQEDDWTCKDGYILTDDETCVKKASCGWRSIYESSSNTCKTIPWHAEKYNDFDWRCRDGYSAYYDDDGEIVCKRKKYDHNDDFSIEVDFVYGGLMDSTIDDQSFGIGVGFEWVWGTQWSLGPAVELGFMYADYPDNMSYYSARLDLAFICAYGAKAFQFYLRPLASFNLGTHVEYESYLHASSNYYVHGAVGGLELGGRLRDVFEIPLNLDLFFRFTSVMFEDNVVGDDVGVFTVGFRTVLF